MTSYDNLLEDLTTTMHCALGCNVHMCGVLSAVHEQHFYFAHCLIISREGYNYFVIGTYYFAEVILREGLFYFAGGTYYFAGGTSRKEITNYFST